MKTEERIAFAERRIDELKLLFNFWKNHESSNIENFSFRANQKKTSHQDLLNAA